MVRFWRRYLDDHAATDEALCGTCDIANFARRFYFHANLPLFRRLHRSGIIYSVDRSANPWEATIFAAADQPESQYYEDLDTPTTKPCGTTMRTSAQGCTRLNHVINLRCSQGSHRCGLSHASDWLG